MPVPITARIKRAAIRLSLVVMPYIPLPGEWYRKLLVADSERRYATRRWNYLGDASEMHRYGAIIACASFFRPGQVDVLDVGCGSGVLQQRMHCARYVGVDMNASAIAEAKARESATVQFLHAPVESYTVPGQFDVIVFNESLYYMPNPVGILQRHLQHLKPGGVVVICMFRTYLARKIWQSIGRLDIDELTSVELVSDTGFSSIVKALGQRVRASA
jgi:SAM-dependent methyltransferase